MGWELKYCASTSDKFDVSFGSEAGICSGKRHVRFTPESDAECVHSNVRYGPIAGSCAGYRSVVGGFEHRQHVVEGQGDDECGAGMSRDISKRWCGAGSTPYILLHRERTGARFERRVLRDCRGAGAPQH